MRLNKNIGKRISLIILVLIFLKLAYAADIGSSSYNSNSTIITSGGGNTNSDSNKNVDTNINSHSTSTSSSSNFKSYLGFINLQATESAAVTPSTSAGTPSGVSGGGGGASIIAPEIDLKFIKIELKQGGVAQSLIKIKNPNYETIPITISVGKLGKFILIDKTEFSLEKNAEKIIKITLFASDEEIPDIYSGFIDVKTGVSIIRIPVIIDVKAKKALFDISVDVKEKDKYINKDGKARADLLLKNLGDLRPVDVKLIYAVKDLDGNVLSFKEETLAVDKELSIARELSLPLNITYDDYLFYARTEYGKETATAGDMFYVRESKPISNIVLANKELFIPVGAIIGIIALLILSIIYLKTREELPYAEKILVDYIKKAKKNHQSEEEIFRDLLRYGWPIHLIEKRLK